MTASHMDARPGSRRRVFAGVWRLIDPKISLASIASLALGTFAAARDGGLAYGWLAVTVVAILAIEAAKNASGEIVDFDSGVDQDIRPEERSPFSGGKRVIVDGWLTRRETAMVAAVCYAVGIAGGVAIALLREPRVWLPGLVGVACAFFYHAPPLRLSYRGLGELTVAACYGPLVACGAYLVQRGSVHGPVLPLSILLGALIAAFLWVNEFPDRRADSAAGKGTLVVRLGARRAGAVFAWLEMIPFVALAALPLFGAPPGVLAGLSGAWSARRATRALARTGDDVARIILAQADALRAFVLFALGAGLGLLLLP
jgi:1,4-dihydroxy-2-naphthoate polyprenyltransferase